LTRESTRGPGEKSIFEYLVKWKGHPVEYASWENEAEDSEAWTDYARTHEHESMKIFKRGSMMQEHHCSSKRAQRRKTAGMSTTHFWHIFENVLKYFERLRKEY
jgi:hypothetical protein